MPMPTRPTNNGAPKAYSYLRFSTPEQERGDSFRRQSEAALKYAEEHDLELDDSLDLRDFGVPAYRGRNIQEDRRLGAFIKAVEEGHVRPGSYLLVESLDRLSRERIRAAFNLLSSLVDKNVIVVTLMDGKVYTQESLDNLTDLIVSLSIMSRAHEESATKSHRMKAAWKAKRAEATDGKAITAMVPRWLQLDKERGEFEIVEDNAECVRRIFSLYLEGHGKGKIAELLNDEGVPPLSARADGWHHSYVGRILTNKAVIGEFQPMREVDPARESSPSARRRVPDGDPIENYFPPVIDRELYFAAQKQRRGRELPSGPRGVGFPNLFRGLAKCGVCGGTMNFMTKGRRWKSSERANIYLQCANARRKASNCGHRALWPYHAVEYFVTEGINDIDFTALFPSVAAGHREALDRLAAEHDGAVGELGEVEEKLKNAAALLVTRPNNPALLNQLDEMTARQSVLEETIVSLASELVTARQQLATIRQRFETQDELLEQWRAGSEDEELRARLNRSLTANFERFEFNPTDDGRSTSYIRHFFKNDERSWTLLVERDLDGRRGRYTGVAAPFDHDGEEWELAAGVSQMWFPPESGPDEEDLR